jgi:hypothetical protein
MDDSNTALMTAHEVVGGCLSVLKTNELVDLLAYLVSRHPGSTQHRIAAAALVLGLRQFKADDGVALASIAELRASSVSRRKARHAAVTQARERAKEQAKAKASE